MFELGLMAGVALFLLWKAREMYFRVEENQVGLVLRFGAARHGADGKLLLAEAGLHFKWPWEEVRIVSLREQMLTLGVGEHAEHAMLNDGTVIRAKSLEARLSAEGGMTVSFGNARLEVGDEPSSPT